MIRQLYSSLHVNGDDNVAHYGNDDVNYGDNDDNDRGAKTDHPDNSRQFETAWKSSGKSGQS